MFVFWITPHHTTPVTPHHSRPLQWLKSTPYHPTPHQTNNQIYAVLLLCCCAVLRFTRFLVSNFDLEMVLVSKNVKYEVCSNQWDTQSITWTEQNRMLSRSPHFLGVLQDGIFCLVAVKCYFDGWQWQQVGQMTPATCGPPYKVGKGAPTKHWRQDILWHPLFLSICGLLSAKLPLWCPFICLHLLWHFVGAK